MTIGLGQMMYTPTDRERRDHDDGAAALTGLPVDAHAPAQRESYR